MVEIRDRATCIPAFAIKMLPQVEEELFLMKQCGYGFSFPCVILISIEAPWHSARSSDEWKNSARTMPIAHKYIEDNFESIESCAVIDVEFILNEVEKPCKSCLFEQMEERLILLRGDNE